MMLWNTLSFFYTAYDDSAARIILKAVIHNRDTFWTPLLDIRSGSFFLLHLFAFDLVFVSCIPAEPNGVDVSLTSACDLANTKCIATCKTSSCTYPSPTFHWFYTTVGSIWIHQMFLNFSETIEVYDIKCDIDPYGK